MGRLYACTNDMLIEHLQRKVRMTLKGVEGAVVEGRLWAIFPGHACIGPLDIPIKHIDAVEVMDWT